MLLQLIRAQTLVHTWFQLVTQGGDNVTVAVQADLFAHLKTGKE